MVPERGLTQLPVCELKRVLLAVSPALQETSIFIGESPYSGAPDALSFEHLVPVWDWIDNLRKVYQPQAETEYDLFTPKPHTYSNGYYTKK